jgi:hypothetical protein
MQLKKGFGSIAELEHFRGKNNWHNESLQQSKQQ